MAVLWSAKENGFFDTRVMYKDLPEDVIEIGEDERERLLTGQNEGWEIYTQPNGKPDLRRRE